MFNWIPTNLSLKKERTAGAMKRLVWEEQISICQLGHFPYVQQLVGNLV